MAINTGNVYSVKNKFKLAFFINKSGSVSKLVMGINT